MPRLTAKDLTIEEKLKLVIGGDHWGTNTLDGKVRYVKMVDGPIGRRLVVSEDKQGRETILPSIAYPCAQALSHAWSEDFAYELGKAIANDMIDVNADILLGPAVNIKRTPLCGRNFEYYSEDPLLSGNLAAAYIKGAQDQHIGTSLKHFCANNIEYARHYCSSNLDERTLREIYLKQFEIAIKESNPWTLMCSYNKVNGTWMSEHTELYKFLREEFKYDGTVVSDWNSVHDAVRTMNSGLDLIMPFKDIDYKRLKEGYEAGEISDDALDSAANNVLNLIYKCEDASKLRKRTMSIKSRKNLAYKLAQNGIVLLKNNNVLPLSNERLVVTGAPVLRYKAGNGSSKVTLKEPAMTLDVALQNANFDCIYKETTRYVPNGQGMMCGTDVTCREELLTRDAVVIAVGNENEFESGDRETIKLCRAEEDAIRHLSGLGKKVIVVLYAGAPVDMSSWIGCVDAVVFASFGGQYQNEAVVDVLTGKFNPCGHLTESFPTCLEDVPAEQAYRDVENFDYDEGLLVGYRYYTTSNYPVLYPFGYGLSYSRFAYSNMDVKVQNDMVKVSFTITNTSDVDGIDIPQIYVGPLSCEPDRPIRELKGYARVAVKKNSSKKVTVDIPMDRLQYFSINTNKWEPCKGKLTFMLGKNSRDIIIEKDIVLA
ncbi:MAG: glycoside hydrolase family 3 C-terminal domain-containing protein [Clostridia bacterium]|nr:glycoside hydrolase family 3 C-terminal domain-containing protein [Clostridia bacterium]